LGHPVYNLLHLLETRTLKNPAHATEKNGKKFLNIFYSHLTIILLPPAVENAVITFAPDSLCCSQFRNQKTWVVNRNSDVCNFTESRTIELLVG